MTYLKSNANPLRLKEVLETSPAKQNNFSSTSTWYDVNYSSIEYTPRSITGKVIYEFNFWYGKDGSSGSNTINLNLKLLKNDGSGWADFGDDTHIFLGCVNDEKRSRSVYTARFCLDNWGPTTLQLKLQGKRESGDIRLHNFIYFYDDSNTTESSEDRFYNPSVICYSLG